eukprot:snap_masked-scaffold_51-processed-gene-0.19-mRNA-1 protein AED:1.00 eAED:1.00 QI:0/-1/0/0/-1/1/1/0/69
MGREGITAEELVKINSSNIDETRTESQNILVTSSWKKSSNNKVGNLNIARLKAIDNTFICDESEENVSA